MKQTRSKYEISTCLLQCFNGKQTTEEAAAEKTEKYNESKIEIRAKWVSTEVATQSTTTKM